MTNKKIQTKALQTDKPLTKEEIKKQMDDKDAVERTIKSIDSTLQINKTALTTEMVYSPNGIYSRIRVVNVPEQNDNTGDSKTGKEDKGESK